MPQSPVDRRDTRSICMAAVAVCDSQLGWHLDEANRQAYAASLASLVSWDLSDERLQEIIVNYHADHALVAALRDATHHGHEEAWRGWMERVMAVVRANGFAWSSDSAIGSDDLGQIAYIELVRALPSYRYQSRFSTWAYKVVVQSMKRHLRFSRAGKRAERPDSLNRLPEADAPLDSMELDSEPLGRLLQERIAAILARQPDQRLTTIFHLWAVQDTHIDDIGSIVQLHPSRVRALLLQIRQLLRGHPELRAWRKAEDE